MIKITGLTKSYGSFRAVDGLTLEIHKNEIFGLLGPNGAGKTTFISMLCGLLPADEGSIRFDGFGNTDTKSLIGYCPQENIFYPKLSCLEQLVYMGELYNIPQKQAKVWAMELLEKLGLTDKTHVQAGKLSGGMKRRLNICLALIHNPEILILDEPEARLDPQSRILVREFVKSIGHEKTVILCTHNMDEADRLAHRIAIIDKGQLLKLDTSQNLKKSIGDGDRIEVRVETTDGSDFDRFADGLAGLFGNVTKGVDCVWMNNTDFPAQLILIREQAGMHGVKISELKLRENTLEDVFIYLTGKELRS